MKSLNSSPESSRMSGVMGPGLIPGHGSGNVVIRVSHGDNQYEVAVPSNSSFGHLRSIICQRLGLKPEMCKLFFGGIEKQDDESLQIAGLKYNFEVLLVEDTSCGQQVTEEVPATPAPSKGEEAVAEVREEVNKLEKQVTALQAVIDSGKKVDDKEIIYLTEMLMRQLLKLDGIEAEGEGKMKRKTEVRRVQIILEKLDTLKSRNSNSSTNKPKDESVATDSKAFESLPSSVPPAETSFTSPAPSSSPGPPVVPLSSLSPTPAPSSSHPIMPSSSSPSVMPSPSPSFMPSSSNYPVPHITPSNMPQGGSAMPHFSPSTQPYSNYPTMPYPAASPMPYFTPSTHYPYQYYDPSQMASYYDPSQMAAYCTPYTVPSPAPAPSPTSTPYHDGSSNMHHHSNPFSMPSTTITHNWEHFG